MPAGSGEGQPQQTIMSIRTSLRDYACTAVALLTVLSGAETALGQQEKDDRRLGWPPRLISPWR